MTVKQRFLFSSVEGVSHGLKCAVNILKAIHMTMEREESPRGFTDSLFGLWDYLNRLQEELEETVQEIYDQKEG